MGTYSDIQEKANADALEQAIADAKTIHAAQVLLNEHLKQGKIRANFTVFERGALDRAGVDSDSLLQDQNPLNIAFQLGAAFRYHTVLAEILKSRIAEKERERTQKMEEPRFLKRRKINLND